LETGYVACFNYRPLKCETYRSHKVALDSVTLVALRAGPASPRARDVDAVDPRVEAAPAVVVEALVDVVAVEAVTAVAGRTGAAPAKIKRLKCESFDHILSTFINGATTLSITAHCIMTLSIIVNKMRHSAL
jgi:hypothetical protein